MKAAKEYAGITRATAWSITAPCGTMKRLIIGLPLAGLAMTLIISMTTSNGSTL